MAAISQVTHPATLAGSTVCAAALPVFAYRMAYALYPRLIGFNEGYVGLMLLIVVLTDMDRAAPMGPGVRTLAGVSASLANCIELAGLLIS